MSRLTRDGTTAEPVSRDRILRRERGQRNIHFPCSADHEQDWQPYPVDPYCTMYIYVILYILHICTSIPRSVLFVCYVCMVTHTTARVWSRGQLNTGNEYFPARVRAWEFGLARRVRQSRPASACSSPYPGWLWCLLTGFLPSSAAASIYSFRTAKRHRVSPEFIGSRNCAPMAFTAESPPARGQ